MVTLELKPKETSRLNSSLADRIQNYLAHNGSFQAFGAILIGIVLAILYMKRRRLNRAKNPSSSTKIDEALNKPVEQIDSISLKEDESRIKLNFIDVNEKSVSRAKSLNSLGAECNRTDVFKTANSQYLINLNAKLENKNALVYNLNHISDKGIFLIAPIRDSLSSLKKSTERKNKTSNKKFKKSKHLYSNLKNKLLKPKAKMFSENELKHNKCVVFNMNPSQQKHFLGIYGPDRNPIVQAKKAYLNKTRFKSSLSSTEQTHIVDLDENVNKFLGDPVLNKAKLKKDNSGGLGRAGVLKLRCLEYKHKNNKEETNDEMKSKNQKNESIPSIGFSIYQVDREEPLDQSKIDSKSSTLDINKLRVTKN